MANRGGDFHFGLENVRRPETTFLKAYTWEAFRLIFRIRQGCVLAQAFSNILEVVTGKIKK